MADQDQTTPPATEPAPDPPPNPAALAVTDPTAPHVNTQAMVAAPVQVLRPTNFKEAQEMATMMAQTDMVPQDYRGKPANIVVAWQLGAELGLSPMQSLQNIANINGRPSIWGDAALALCKAHHSYINVKEWVEGDGDKMVAHCLAQRKGEDDVTVTFSVGDAKTAGLWGKNVWKNYPKRMLQCRARGFALRDQWPDVLKGIHTVEERQGEVIESTATVVDLDKAGTQSFRKPSSPPDGDPPDVTTPADSGPAVELTAREAADMAEAMELIAGIENWDQWKEVGITIADAKKAGKWGHYVADKIRTAYIGKHAEMKTAGNGDAPAWPGGDKPPAGDGGFGF